MKAEKEHWGVGGGEVSGLTGARRERAMGPEASGWSCEDYKERIRFGN